MKADRNLAESGPLEGASNNCERVEATYIAGMTGVTVMRITADACE
jgi:hypothetical protein